jgi:hypothetical protein
MPNLQRKGPFGHHLFEVKWTTTKMCQMWYAS